MNRFIHHRLVQPRAPRGRFARAVSALALAAVFAAACGDTTGPEQLSTLTITPQTQTVAVNGTVQFTAAGTRTGFDVTTIKGAVWSVTGGGTITQEGLFTAGPAPGTSTITITCGGLARAATVTVTAGPLATITVTPNPATLAIGAQQQFTAVGRDAGGNVVPITPVWTATSPPGTINAATGLFTAGTLSGTFANSVRATAGALFGTATVIVTPGPLLTITVTPNPATLDTSTVQTFTAVGRDAGNNVVAINPAWSVTNGGGTIPAGTTGQTAPFTAGSSTGTFTNTVRATQGAVFGTATVIVTAPPATPPPTPPASTFRVLARVAVACTDGSIAGDVGTFEDAPTGSFTPVNCPVTAGTAQVGTAASIAAYNDFVAAYDARETVACGTVLTGTLAGVTLPPGVYCFDNAATLTGTLTLNGPPTGVWLIKVGTSGVGALTGTGFSVVMAGGASACNVTWWVEDAATMTDSNLRGAILAGGDVTATRGTLHGNAWSQGDVTITGTVLSACNAP